MNPRNLPDIGETKDMDVDEVLIEFSSSFEGISGDEALKRVNIYGLNQIETPEVNHLYKLAGYFWGPIPWMIEIAAGLSAVIFDWIDFSIIFLLLLINALVGFVQEYKATAAIELLKEKLAYEARVKRNGEWVKVPAAQLVPGDIIRVRGGDIIPADIKLIKGDYLFTDESSLTGESMPIEKYPGDVAYSGSIVKQGEMTSLVVSTGESTYFGRTAHLISEVSGKSHLEEAVVKIGDYLIILDFILVSIIFVASMFRHENLVTTVKFILVLSVASIPIAQPAVLSVTMAVGATVLAKKGAIVSKLAAIEEMASMNILCSDKTGTITKNSITVSDLVPFEPFNDANVLLFAALASKEEDKDPIDLAILKKARKDGLKVDGIPGCKRLKFKPFDPVSKRSEGLMEYRNLKFKVSKGAPQAMLSLGRETHELIREVNDYVDKLAENGYRALGISKTDKKGEWLFVGLIALYDPPREDSAATIKKAEEMGTSVKMVTGDHVAIAREIGIQVNIGRHIVEADKFRGRSYSESKRIIEDAEGFAEVFPEDKYHIVDVLQMDGNIVGMTGDGVNDAPALKKADVGIAVAEATDAAKSSADIVFTNPGLSVIIDAIKESRRIFQRMRGYSIYRVTETIRILFFTAVTILVFNLYPVNTLMLVMIALLDDLPIMTIAYDNTNYSKEPKKWDMNVVLGMSTILGLIGVVTTFLLFYIGKEVFYLTPDQLRSFIFLKLVVAGHLTMFATRLEKPFWTNAPSKLFFSAIILTDLAATLMVAFGFLMKPVGIFLVLFVWFFAVAGFLIEDYVKVRFYRRWNRKL